MIGVTIFYAVEVDLINVEPGRMRNRLACVIKGLPDGRRLVVRVDALRLDVAELLAEHVDRLEIEVVARNDDAGEPG